MPVNRLHYTDSKGMDLILSSVWVCWCRLTAKAVAVLLPILGISWIFGVLAVNDQSLLFQYMFAAFNSLQVCLHFSHHYANDQKKNNKHVVFVCPSE